MRGVAGEEVDDGALDGEVSYLRDALRGVEAAINEGGDERVSIDHASDVNVHLELIKVVGGDDLLNERLGRCDHSKGGCMGYVVEGLDPLG